MGYAYLGAIKALEDARLGRLLPVTPSIPGRIRGISGASAGAITATLVALGCRSDELEAIFKQREVFKGFYDDPDCGHCRGINKQALSGTRLSLAKKNDAGSDIAEGVHVLLGFLKSFRNIQDEALKYALSAGRNIGPYGPMIMLYLLILGNIPRTSVENAIRSIEKDLPFAEKMLKRPAEYLLNLTNDRGLFPGFAIRKFLKDIIRKRVIKIGSPARIVRGDAADIDFQTFQAVTGIDLRISGTNISQRRSFIFSAETSPMFSVAEAVGISSCYPLVFKPIYVKADERDNSLGPLRGLWVDGGLLNNFPVHAFDRVKRVSAGNIPSLDSGMLGFLLQEGDPISQQNYYDPEREENPLLAFAGGLLQTALVPGNSGQLRTEQERRQTVSLFTYSLSLFEFSPDAGVFERPVEEARKAVLDHFGF